MSQLSQAQVSFNPAGVLTSEQFDDIYFSVDDGLAESEYVFQQGNDIEQKWLAHSSDLFTVAETGFGTGLNLIALCLKFEQFKQAHPETKIQRLHFISFEKYPITKEIIKQSLTKWPQLSPWVTKLIDNYPYILPGFHRLQLTDSISLDLIFGDVNEQINQINEVNQGVVDAWFLDGFAPSKNPSMWQQNLFEQMARLSKQNASFATFTAAGAVKRGLTQAGFTVSKRKGFGRKREMLIGYLAQKVETQPLSPFYPVESVHNTDSKTVTILGGGISAICSALQLGLKGYKIELICENEIASEASGNKQGALYPHLQADTSQITEVNLKAFEYACQFYQRMVTKFNFSHDFCGVIQLGFNPKIAAKHDSLCKMVWPNDLLMQINTEQVNALSNMPIDNPGLYFPNGGWLNPVSFIQNAVNYLKDLGLLQLKTHTKINNIAHQDNQWQLTTIQASGDQVTITADILINCTGWRLNQFNSTAHISITPIQGQVTEISPYDSENSLNQLKTVICHKGYLTPKSDDSLCIGATFNRQSTCEKASREQDLINLEQQKKFLPKLATDFDQSSLVKAKSAIRATTIDHLPIVGNVTPAADLFKDYALLSYGQRCDWKNAESFPNYYVLAGLGARGLTSAPLLAEHISSLISQQSLPFAQTSINALHPNRFSIKKIKQMDTPEQALAESQKY